MERATHFYQALITSVHDGDTFHCTIKLELGLSLDLTCRMYGINAPEIHGDSKEAGLVSTEWLRKAIDTKTVVLDLSHGREKYGRSLAVVWLDDRNINQEMVDLNLAIEYMLDKT